MHFNKIHKEDIFQIFTNLEFVGLWFGFQLPIQTNNLYEHLIVEL